MKTSTALALGGLGALAWYLSRRGTGAVAGAVPGPSFGPPTQSPNDAAIAGTEYVGQTDWFLTTGYRATACNLPEDRHTAWSDEQKQCVAGYHKARAQAFYDMVWRPASRVPISSLTPQDFQLAAAFLANKLDRRGVPWTYGQSKAVDDFNDSGAIAFLVGFNYISKAFGYDSSKATDAAKAEFAKAIVDLPTVTQGGENQLTVKEVPYAGDQDYGDPIFAQYGEANKAWDAVFIDPRGPSLDFGFEPIEFPWGNLYFRCQLFRAAQSANGWEKPWVSRELGYAHDDGDGHTLTDKSAQPGIIAKQARMFRTLDVLGGMLKPDVVTMVYGATPDADGNVNVSDLKTVKNVRPGLYAYKVGTVELWGCVLPAAPEDQAQDLRDIVGKGLARAAYGGDLPLPNAPAESSYTPYVQPPPSGRNTAPTVNKGAPAPTQTATSGYNLPASNAGAPTPSPTIAGGGRRLSHII